MILFFAASVALIPGLLGPLTQVLAWPAGRLLPGEAMLARNALVRQPNRTALTVAGLMVSSSLVVAVAGLTAGALGSGEHWVDSLFVSDRLVVSPVHQGELIRQEVNKLSGVAGSSPISFFSLRSGDRALNMAAIDPLEYAARGRLDFVAGSRQTAFTAMGEGRAVLISRRLAASRNLNVGSRLKLAAGSSEAEYKVAAVLQHTFPSPDGDETALISVGNAHQDFGVEGFNILQVIPGPDAPSGFDEQLKQHTLSYGMQLESLADVRAGVRKGVNSLLFLLTAVGLVGVVLGLLSVVTTMLLNIRESARELGLLRAVGLTRGQAQRLILTQANLLVLGGGLLGSLLGLVLAAVMVRAGSSSGFTPAYVVPWQAVLLLVLASAVGSTIAVLLPARRASGASIVEAVRYE
jgi:putative ABC transport system permease protein